MEFMKIYEFVQSAGVCSIFCFDNKTSVVESKTLKKL